MPKIKKTLEFIALESFMTKFQCIMRVQFKKSIGDPDLGQKLIFGAHNAPLIHKKEPSTQKKVEVYLFLGSYTIVIPLLGQTVLKP